ncbi:MAG: hypothetical protein JSW38_10015, partial [Dehalococcoidia bacterium]
MSDQQWNTAEATGAYNDDTATATDPAYYFGANISIDLEKSVSVDNQVTFTDADVAHGPTVSMGSDIYFKFVVTNTSNVKLNQITLTDSDYDLSGCTIPSTLDPGASFSCTIGPLPADVDQHTNTATATGSHSSYTATATDDANYFGGHGAIDVEKYVRVVDGPMGSTDWMDADATPGPEVIAGSEVEFRFVITNIGDIPLYDVTVTDPTFPTLDCSEAGPLAPGDSFECVIGPFSVELDPEDSTSWPHTNTAEVTATYDGQTVSDTDSANFDAYFWSFTPGFWKNNTADKGKQSHDAWKYTAYNTQMTLGEVFGTAAPCLYEISTGKGKGKLFSDHTLLEALAFRGGEDLSGKMEILLRELVASLLNASFHATMVEVSLWDGVYPYSTEYVIDTLALTLCSGNETEIVDLFTQLTVINSGIHYIDWGWPAP